MKRSVLHSEELLYEAAGKPADLEGHSNRIAHVVSVGGSHAIAVVDNQNNLASNVASEDAIVLGSVMALPNSESTVIGIVSGMSTPMPTAHDVIDELTLLELRLCGEISANESKNTLEFGPGVTRYPTIGDPVTWASRSELACIYGQIKASTIEIGNLFQDTSVPALLKEIADLNR